MVLVVGFAVSGVVEGVSSAKLENRGEDWWKHTAAASVSLTHKHTHMHTRARRTMSTLEWL